MTPPSTPQLHNLIDAYFDEDDFRELCFELSGPYAYDNLRGRAKRDKVYELVAVAIRRNELPLLIAALEQKRPAVEWSTARVPAAPQVFSPKHRPAIVTGAILILVTIIGALTWLYFRPSMVWANNLLLPEDELGIAVAELGVSGDCHRGGVGREVSWLLYDALEKQIQSVGLQRRAPLSRVGLVCSQEQAIQAGERVAADIVIWGWVPQTTDGILGHYTFVEPPAGIGATTLANSLELLVSGPAESRYFRLTGRTESLVRFVLGLVYAEDEDYKSSLAMFTRAIQIIEADEETAANDDSLAVVYTQLGKIQAAMNEPELAFTSYRKAESLNPEYIGLQIALGAYFYSRREWDNARAYFDKANLQGEELSSIAYGYGLLDYYAGNFEAAVTNFQIAAERSVALEEEPLLPWLGLGYAYRQMGRCIESAAVFEAIVHSETAKPALRQAAATEIGNCEVGKPTTPAATTAMSPATATPLSTMAVEPSPTQVSGQICAVNATLVRPSAAIDEAHIAVLAPGDRVEWVEHLAIGEWYFVRLGDGRTGWVSLPSAVPCDAFTSTITPLPPTMLPPLMPGPTPLLTLPIPTRNTQPISTVPSAPSIPVPTGTLPPAPTSNPIAPEPATATPTLLPNPTLLPTPPPLPTPTLLPGPPPTDTPPPTTVPYPPP